MEKRLVDVIRPGPGRGLDFVILSELRKRTGITKPDIVKFAMSEMLCNSLDTDATIMSINIQKEGVFDKVTVSDNGTKKFSLEDVKLILDFQTKASSKRGFFMVSRGYLGNALKCLFGYSYALAVEKKLSPPNIKICSHNTEYIVQLKPNKVTEIIESEIQTNIIEDTGWNTFTIKFPFDYNWLRATLREDVTLDLALQVESSRLYDILFASSVVNPTRKIQYNLWNVLKGSLGRADESYVPRRETSIIWYEKDQFKALFKDFVRAAPDTTIKDFASIFRGFYGPSKVKIILLKMEPHDHDYAGSFREFYLTTPIVEFEDDDIDKIYQVMLDMAQKIKKASFKKVLGIVGKNRFEDVKEQHNWNKLKYTKIEGRNDDWKAVSYPFIVEIAFFERGEDDNRGVKIYQCVNFMASMEDIFSKLYNLNAHLAKCGVEDSTPITLVAHLICPVLKWLNYGKSGLYE